MKTYLYYFTTLVSIVLISMGCEKEMISGEHRGGIMKVRMPYILM